MLKQLNKNQAQIIGEYVTTITLVIVMVIGMTVFVRRAFQARIKDAKDAMIGIARASYNGTIPDDYEPYYLKRSSDVSRETDNQIQLFKDTARGNAWVLKKVYNEETTAATQSYQAPPKDAK